jgi:hypothetical protein
MQCRWEREKDRLSGQLPSPLPSRNRKLWTGICEVDECEKPTTSETHYTCYEHGWHIQNQKRLNQYQKDRRDILKWGLPEGSGAAVRAVQEDRCPICRISFPEFSQQPDYDHDHETKLFRGLACRRCNRTVIGLVENNIELVLRTLDYLINPPAQQLFPGLKITKERD